MQKQIAQRNDEFRKAILTDPNHVDGKAVLTAGIAGLDTDELAEVLTEVKNFSDFSVDNDPHQEHDFGSVTIDGEKVFWKIDYYADEKLDQGTEDTLNSYRVLTIMFADEY